MKILHTSDWHLGKKLDNFSRHTEQLDVLDEIVEVADNEHVDIVLIAGDIFDTFNPPIESIELFYKTIKRLCKHGQRPVVAIAGNHDSPDRIEAPDALALEDAIILSGKPASKIRHFKNEAGVEVSKSDAGFIELQLPNYNYPIRIVLSPYANHFRLKKFLGLENNEEELRKVLEKHWKTLAEMYCDKNGINIYCGHLFFAEENSAMAEEPDDEKPILHMGGAQAIFNRNLPNEIQYAALGHLHRKQTISNQPCPIVYCGSPISYSFSEVGQKKYVNIIELEPAKNAVIKSIELKKGKALVRKSFDDMEEAISWLKKNQDKLVELTIVSDNFLTANDRKRLNKCHKNIITLIPEVKSVKEQQTDAKKIDLNKNIPELFKDYFKSKHQQEPNDEILKILNEILSTEKGE